MLNAGHWNDMWDVALAHTSALFLVVMLVFAVHLYPSVLAKFVGKPAASDASLVDVSSSPKTEGCARLKHPVDGQPTPTLSRQPWRSC
jgi:hypothetical protein